MDQPKTLTVPEAGRLYFDLGRNASYEAARGGDMRCATARQQRRVRGLWANLAAKSQSRNDGLNYTAWQFSQFIETGDLKVEVAGKLLWLACEANGYLAKDGADVVKEMINRV